MAIQLLLSSQMLKAHSRSTSSIQTGTVLADLKLIFVPLIFLLLRVWSVITDVSAYYLADSKREEFSNTHAAAIILLLAVSNYKYVTQSLWYLTLGG